MSVPRHPRVPARKVECMHIPSLMMRAQSFNHLIIVHTIMSLDYALGRKSGLQREDAPVASEAFAAPPTSSSKCATTRPMPY